VLIGGAAPDRLEYGSFGTTPGPYESLSALGIKILPESLAAAPRFRERFDRDVIRVARWSFEPPYPRLRLTIEEDADYGSD